MSVKLQIDDGLPYWWDSQSIWVVPGDDPLGAPGIPAVGDTAYLWATVRNLGSSDVQQAKVDFWVANPSLQLRKSVARAIGSAYVDIAANGTQDVLCLTPWSVELVNGGHECVIAEVSAPSDPLTPPPSDPDLIDPPTYRQVAQRNLTIVVLPPEMMMVLTLGVHAGSRAKRAVQVDVEVGGKLDRGALDRLGLDGWRPGNARAIATGLTLERGHARNPAEARRHAIDLPAGRSAPLYLHLQARERLDAGHYVLVRVIEQNNGKPTGGISFVVTGSTAAPASKGR